MIERTGVDPEAANWFCPRSRDCLVHQAAAEAAADRFRHEPEKTELARAVLAKVEFQQSDALPIVPQGVGFDPRIAENGAQSCLRQFQT